MRRTAEELAECNERLAHYVGMTIEKFDSPSLFNQSYCFHSDLNLLMLVVDKIEKGRRFTIISREVLNMLWVAYIVEGDPVWKPAIVNQELYDKPWVSSRREAIYEAVVEFINQKVEL